MLSLATVSIVVILFLLVLLYQYRRHKIPRTGATRRRYRSSFSTKRYASSGSSCLKSSRIGSVGDEFLSHHAANSTATDAVDLGRDKSCSEEKFALDADAVLGLNNNSIAAKEEGGYKSQPVSSFQPSNDQPQGGGLDQEDSVVPAVIVLYLEADESRPFSGYELLQAVLASGLRYGKRNIFHRHEKKAGKGAILFSLASAVSVGTFDLSNMGGFSTPALTLFLQLEGLSDPMAAFEIMLQVAGQLTDDLGGKVLDSERKILTQESVRDLCLSINTLQKNRQTIDMFEKH